MPPTPAAEALAAPPAEAPHRGLHAKMAEVQATIGVMPKDRTVNVEKNGQRLYTYEYLSESALMLAVRQELAKRGVAVYVSTTGQRREGQLTMVDVAITFADGGTNETFTITGQGQGADQGDKGLYKAITGGVRYMLWKTFLVPTEGDDPNQPHDISAQRTDRPATVTEAMERIGRFVEDARPWIVEAVVESYPELDGQFPENWRQLPDGVQVNAFARLTNVVYELEAEPNFDPCVDPDVTQRLMQRAFSKGFEGRAIVGPDPFRPPIPFG